MTVALLYSSPKTRLEHAREVFGIQVAIEDLVRAYLRFARAEKITFLIGAKDEWDEILRLGRGAGVDPSRLVALDRRFPENNLSHISSVFCLEPDTHRMLWQRQINGSFSFCALAHAISGVEAGQILQEYCLAPSFASDAIICPSKAVKSAIRNFWDSYGAYLGTRFGAAYRCPVELPVIPLGIDVDAFASKVSPEKRRRQRAELGIADDEILLLWVGRLSAAIKAHPLAMFQAAERAAELSGMRVHLVMVGYFVPREAEVDFRKLAGAACAKARVTFVASDDPRFPEGVWAAGDIFLSLIDNIQESFGLTPIEAMAAGLPRVVSDWDGYRDSVADGEDGFLVRTTQPPPGNGADLTAQVLCGREVYGGYLAKTALTVAVDADQAGQRLAHLIGSKDLRARMAEKGRAKVRDIYDWKHIIPAYEALWEELAARRLSEAHDRKGRFGSALPQLPDPYTMYEAFPTACLSEKDRLYAPLSNEAFSALLSFAINVYALDVLLPAKDLLALFGWVRDKGEVSIADVFAQFSSADKPRLWRTLAWLIKMGALKFSLPSVKGHVES